MQKKEQNLLQNYFFAKNVSVRVRILINRTRTTAHVRDACAIRSLAKRTRACDVRAAENRVCECACVRGKKSSQLTV